MSGLINEDDDYTYKAIVSRVVDGDTLKVTLLKKKTLSVDWGFSIVTRHTLGFEHKMSIRLQGIDTPETRGPKAKLQKEAGNAATAFVRTWLDANCHKNANGDWFVWLCSHDGNAIAPGKYSGRWIAEVYPRELSDDTTLSRESLNHALLVSGHAVAYP